MNSILGNKRGDIASIIYIVMFLVIIGIIIFLVVDVNGKLFTGLEQELNNSAYNNTEAHIRAAEFRDMNMGRTWDYAFLGIFIGSIIAIALSAYAVRISPIFYWIYGVLALVVLTLGTILSNIWQALAVEEEFATTITNFPIMNSLLGTYYPMIVTAIVVIAMVVLFGKSPGGER